MTRAFIWHQKVKIANLQLSNVMLKDRDLYPVIMTCITHRSTIRTSLFGFRLFQIQIEMLQKDNAIEGLVTHPVSLF